MLDRERLVATFDVMGLEVTTSPLHTLAGRVTDETAKRVITEIGIPERVGGYLTFDHFGDGPTFISDVSQDGSLPQEPRTSSTWAPAPELCSSTGGAERWEAGRTAR
ncbi:MAG TPA: hypothetical protein VM347_22565 [Nonomuraea sp.]|nr:hypothetical protein [Nonomuraea sp.]